MEKEVQTNIGRMSISDYLEIKAIQYGYDSYADLTADGLCIDVPREDIEIEEEE